VVNCGARDENDHEVGMAHFIEHMLFKGTSKRKAFHIISRMDSVGAELNAYTTKEKTCIYASFLNTHLERAVELLTDVTFDSTFPEHEMKKEKKVVADEMIMYEDNPEESIFDDFLARFYPKHSLGNNILGTVDSLKSFTNKGLKEFTKRNYVTGGMLFSVISSIPFEVVKKIVEKYIEPIKEKKGVVVRQPVKKHKLFNATIEKDFVQSHCMIGGRSYRINHPNRYALSLLNNLLGGPGMNSRLNLSIREKYGFCYQINTDINAYIDSGVMNIYFGTDPKYMNKCKELVYKELKKLRDVKLTSSQLSKAKQQLTGQIAMGEENRSSLMLALGRSLLDTGNIVPLSELFNRINTVEASQILDVANELFAEDQLCELVYQPVS
jgi:predicted Zn-dependent peptidase